MDLTPVDLEGLSPSAIIMVVSLTASTSGKPLSEDNLGKKKPLKCNRWQCCCLQTDGYCGWSGVLAKMSACNVQLLGAKRKNRAGFSTATSQSRVGYLKQTEVF
jgi:U4/U6 small nuclear ribonucleoprotein PRP31